MSGPVHDPRGESQVPGTFKYRPGEVVETPFTAEEIAEYRSRIETNLGPIAALAFKLPRRYRLDMCNILVSRDGPNELWHLSISHPHRYPTWDEIKTARYELCPLDITMAMMLPPPMMYVNTHDNTFGLWEITDPREAIL